MKIRWLTAWNLLLILLIVAFAGPFAKVGEAAPPAAGKPAAAAAPATKPAASATPPAGTAPATPDAASTIPLLLQLTPKRDIYHAREAIPIQAEFYARQAVTMCIYPDHPEANFTVTMTRGGYGKVEVPPNVVQLSREDQAKVMHVPVDAGQTYHIIFNLKKVVQVPTSFWKTGEYYVQMKYYLCGKTANAETAIPSQGPFHLLILE